MTLNTDRVVADSVPALLPAGAPASELRLRDLTVGYRQGRRRPPNVVLGGIDAQVRGGQMVGLVGPNGSGKSTLLRSVVGLQPPLGGRALLDGDDLASLPRRRLAQLVATVLTDRFDAGRMRVTDVVGLGRHPYTDWSGRFDADDEKVVAESLAAVDAEPLAEAEVGELSDGQRQRVMVARALAQQPSVLLLDEPTSFLDPPSRVRLLELLRRLATAQRIAVVVCTHDIEAILGYADLMWVAGRDTTLITGSPEELAYSGALATPFATPGVEFDASTLTFVADHAWRPTASVDGAGPAADLARHALRRAGFDVPRSPLPPGPAASPLDPQVTVHATPDRWVLRTDEQERVHDSLGSLHAHAVELARSIG